MWLVAVPAPRVLGVQFGVVDHPQGVAAVVGDCDRDRVAGCADVTKTGRPFPIH
jgi:hypothetical protein